MRAIPAWRWDSARVRVTLETEAVILGIVMVGCNVIVEVGDGYKKSAVSPTYTLCVVGSRLWLGVAVTSLR